MDYIIVDDEDVEPYHLVEALHNIKIQQFPSASFSETIHGVRIGRDRVIIVEGDGNVGLDLRMVSDRRSEVIAEEMNAYESGSRIFEYTYGENVPLDDIDPVHVGGWVPLDTDEFVETFEDWMYECATITNEELIETGFYQDGMDNIVGIVEGEREYIIWPDNLIDRNALMFHTHPDPPFTADMSLADIEVFATMNSDPSASAIVSTFGHNDIFMLSYDYKYREEIPEIDVEAEVENYISSVRDMVKYEIETAKTLDDEGLIDLDSKRYGIGSTTEIVSKRVDNNEKREAIRNIVESGWGIEHTWNLIDRR